MRFELSSRAERDIHELYLHGVSAYGFKFTEEYTGALRTRISQLARMPYLGAAREDVGPGIRLLVFKAHHIPYRVDSGRVLIVRVLHRRANWSQLV
jgi:toxin ParE1/3/4